MSKLNTESCPKCGCWMVRSFECNCGELHGYCCLNCGRYAAPTLRRDEYADLDEFTQECKLGPIEHNHTATT
jgi:hypothetical protein